ncbi:hypothetical protein Rumeso_01369 [Rubellimicrobium mesophilum DSM 19309]|uniref:Uncharacterized protein n=1 Tax=Rubellimicrobium mesophilum DSM 19309 TaxID=442562 RepID=A0A017HS19_9RHOB|nr:hypothetical protein Rumeso_01369 [Rubellimicrobium mesophilum DSM 19309]
MLHPAKVEGASPMRARRLIEEYMLAELLPLLEDTGPFPMPTAGS